MEKVANQLLLPMKGCNNRLLGVFLFIDLRYVYNSSQSPEMSQVFIKVFLDFVRYIAGQMLPAGRACLHSSSTLHALVACPVLG